MDSSATSRTPKKPKRSLLSTATAPSAGAEEGSSAEHVAPSSDAQGDVIQAGDTAVQVNGSSVASEALVQGAAQQPTASTASTYSPQSALVAPQATSASGSAPAAPASGVTGVVSNVLAWAPTPLRHLLARLA